MSKMISSARHRFISQMQGRCGTPRAKPIARNNGDALRSASLRGGSLSLLVLLLAALSQIPLINLRFLSDNRYTVIAMPDLARYIDAKAALNQHTTKTH
jgi:hypothetical protein